jgi:DNA-binding MarR family transcriptional regulator
VTTPGESLDALRVTMGKVMAADRRLRSREHHHPQTGLTSSHLRALRVLTQQPEATIGTLAKEADLNPASATAMVDQLEARGLAARRRDDRDRRLCWISLTDAGRKEVEDKERQWRSHMAVTFSDIPPGDIEAATRVLERLVFAMEHLEVVEGAAGGRPSVSLPDSSPASRR